MASSSTRNAPAVWVVVAGKARVWSGGCKRGPNARATNPTSATPRGSHLPLLFKTCMTLHFSRDRSAVTPRYERIDNRRLVEKTCEVLMEWSCRKPMYLDRPIITSTCKNWDICSHSHITFVTCEKTPQINAKFSNGIWMWKLQWSLHCMKSLVFLLVFF